MQLPQPKACKELPLPLHARLADHSQNTEFLNKIAVKNQLLRPQNSTCLPHTFTYSQNPELRVAKSRVNDQGSRAHHPTCSSTAFARLSNLLT